MSPMLPVQASDTSTSNNKLINQNKPIHNIYPIQVCIIGNYTQREYVVNELSLWPNSITHFLIVTCITHYTVYELIKTMFSKKMGHRYMHYMYRCQWLVS